MNLSHWKIFSIQRIQTIESCFSLSIKRNLPPQHIPFPTPAPGLWYRQMLYLILRSAWILFGVGCVGWCAWEGGGIWLGQFREAMHLVKICGPGFTESFQGDPSLHLVLSFAEYPAILPIAQHSPRSGLREFHSCVRFHVCWWDKIVRPAPVRCFFNSIVLMLIYRLLKL